MKVEYLAWDSDFFKQPIYAIELIDADKIESLHTELKKLEKAGLIYIFTSHQYKNLSSNTIELVDEKVVFQANLEQLQTINTDQIQEYTSIFPIDQLYQLAFESGKYSRFKLDRKISLEKFQEMYKIWIDNSIAHIIADKVFCYIEDKKILGMITFKINHDIGTIGLIAVSPSCQGKQIGKKLITRVKQYSETQKISSLEVATQKNNKLACHFYESCGFNIKSITNIYHKWK